MQLSYWEHHTWLNNLDFAIMGSGLVGLHCALRLREKFPEAKIAIFERGILPQGASTKNAGFACFGSVSEIWDDFQHAPEDQVLSLIEKRWQGIQKLQSLGDSINYENFGGYELFLENDPKTDFYFHQINTLNQLLKPIFKQAVFEVKDNYFGFGKIHPKVIFNAFESQIDTGKMIHELLKKATAQNIFILNNCLVENVQDHKDVVSFEVHQKTIFAKHLMIAANGFAQSWFPEELQPARAQVLVTKPINNLKIQGTFHIDSGYYYFRNIHNRILLGGGRNLAFEEETTTKMETTQLIQNELYKLLKDIISPHQNFEVDYSWSGIMGVGLQKIPIIKKVSNHIYCGVRLGGMGVALGSEVGTSLADLIED